MPGFSVRQRERCADPAWTERFLSLPVACVSDAMHRLAAGGPALRPMHRQGSLAGPAVTVLTRPGDNLMVHKAIDMAAAGDVIVVDAGGDLTNAIIGELMVAYARKKGVAGIVIYGAIRDSEEIGAADFPVYASGITHRGPYKDGPGEVNCDISLNGMIVRPGDLVLGDRDGLLAVPIEQLHEIYEAANRKHEAEKAQLENIAAGLNDRTWVDRELLARGCAGLVAAA